MSEGKCGDPEALRRQGVLIVEQGGRGGVADYTGFLAAALAARGVPVTIATAADHLYQPTPGVRIATIFVYVRGHSPPARLIRARPPRSAGQRRSVSGLAAQASRPVAKPWRHSRAGVGGSLARPGRDAAPAGLGGEDRVHRPQHVRTQALAPGQRAHPPRPGAPDDRAHRGRP